MWPINLDNVKTTKGIICHTKECRIHSFDPSGGKNSMEKAKCSFQQLDLEFRNVDKIVTDRAISYNFKDKIRPPRPLRSSLGPLHCPLVFHRATPFWSLGAPSFNLVSSPSPPLRACGRWRWTRARRTTRASTAATASPPTRARSATAETSTSPDRPATRVSQKEGRKEPAS